MKLMQLYLNESTWKALHVRSRQLCTSVSELVRQAVHEKYGGLPAARRQALRALVGLRKDRRDLPDSKTYARRLRKGKRLKRISS